MTVAIPETLQDAEVKESIWTNIRVSVCEQVCAKKWQRNCRIRV